MELSLIRALADSPVPAAAAFPSDPIAGYLCWLSVLFLSFLSAAPIHLLFVINLEHVAHFKLAVLGGEKKGRGSFSPLGDLMPYFFSVQK